MDKIEKEYEELVKLCNSFPYVYIYGNGVRGKEHYDYLTNAGVKICGFIVSDDYEDGNHEGTIKLSNLQTPQDETLIVLALNKVYHDTVMRQIMERGYLHSYKTTLSLRGLNLIKKYTEKGVDFSKEVLEIGGFKIYNMFLFEKYFISTVFEIADLILPYIGDTTLTHEGCYEDGKVQLKVGDTVIDCGANIGIFSAVAAQKGCKVYAFEPTPETIHFLEKTVQLHGDSIQIVPYALSDKEETLQFSIYNDAPECNSLVHHKDDDGKIEIQAITLDDYVERNHISKVDFIKADIEGAERNMLRGAERTIKRFKPKISICTYHLEDDKEVLEGILRSFVPEYHIEHKWQKLYAWVED
jgi:FkbM family methyltransferase